MREIYPRCLAGETPGGLQVLVEPMLGFRGAALGLWVKAGGREDPPGREGLAHFVEHMTFKGTTRRTALELAQSIDALGGHLNAATTAEYTFYYTEVLSTHIPEAWDTLMELVNSPRFAPEDLTRERVVIAEEIRSAEDDPEDTAFRLLGELLWQDNHPLGRSVIGRLDSISCIDLEDLWQFFEHHYHPGKMVFVACGGVDPEQVFSLAERFPTRSACPNAPLRIPPQPRAGLTLAERDIKQVHLVLGFPTVSASASERYSLEVLNAFLGGGVSSRLFQRVREELGLVYAVFSATAYFSDAGVISIYAATEERKLPQVVEAIWAEVEGLRREPPGKKDVKRAVQRLCNAFLLNLDDPSSRMIRLGTLAALGRRPISPEQVIQRFAQATPEAIQELARRFLSAERTAWAAVGPSQGRIRQALRPFVEAI